ncbi:putative quinol monooxygenase [Salinibacterium hongtaonis]|uniref:Antibiotic biosynthesis monooxygenase n=1 Tax=Homoserinimonas hongtaonis TaxID=2079791 RepID=A0A2U1T1P9_9MICO|nr:putative quinol monooxygenase [Salinibacterium hongtaonis]AWB90341.1 antibiotic biosynthesis monooxygenase [Salinibacterium hongtaonis]PWB97770.1 antibiotic biosynthesis monooxygenase [Salinibacterium hongtaonis]
MAFICSATWTAKAGEEQTVLDAIENLAPASRMEPGNLYYQPYQDPSDPSVFRIFEVYTDEDAFKAHGQTEHFEKWALGQAIPALASREREFYETLNA